GYVTAADIQQQSQIYGHQYQYPAPQTVNPYAIPTESNELRTRSLSDSGYMSRASTIHSANGSFLGITPRVPLTPQARSFNQQPNSRYNGDLQADESPLPDRPVIKPKSKKKKGKQQPVSCHYEHCLWEGRCESERKKHIQQKHTKPFKCGLGDCAIQFGSKSDRKRHQSSIHPDGRGPKFRCFADAKCEAGAKIYKRKDNFTAHLQKCHDLTPEQVSEQLRLSNQWLFDITQQSNRATLQQVNTHYPASLVEGPVEPIVSQPQDVASLNGLGSSFPPNNTHLGPLATEGFLETRSGYETRGGARDDTASLVGGCLEDNKAINMPEFTGQSGKSPVLSSSIIHSAQNGQTSGPSHRQPILSLPRSEYSDEIVKSLQKVDLTFSQPEPTQPAVEVDKYPCTRPGCNFSCRMPSLLKKHVKRHDRPYGCTFADCYKRFGSKADWKRHEIARHSHVPAWRCDDPDRDYLSRDCARMFERKEVYRAHLRDHGVHNEAQIRQRLEDNKIGGDCQFQFWCGFCKGLVKVTRESFYASNERFDHICSEHFEKGQDISSWLLPHCHLTKEQAKQLASEKASAPASSITETTRRDSIGSWPLPSSEAHSTPAYGLQRQDTPTSLGRGNNQIRTFRSGSRNRRSRASKSPSFSLKRRREKSRSASGSPSAPARKVSVRVPPQQQATELQQPTEFIDPQGDDMGEWSEFFNADDTLSREFSLFPDTTDNTTPFCG
ncbi:hypothetical protein FQN49_003186, partial [Arthroderma sp. PD_2]